MVKGTIPQITPPIIVIVAGEKGGVGKSLTALVLADVFHLYERPLSVLQIDRQARLSRALGDQVATIHIDPKLARRDPATAARAYTPIYAAIERAASGGPSVLIDIGANEAVGFAQWLGLADLHSDVAQWAIPVLVVVPYLAESEAMSQAARTARLILEQIPTAQLLLVENRRDGAAADLHPASDAAATYQQEIMGLVRSARTMVMPLIEAGSWRPFEAAGCRMIDVVAMPIDRIINLTGLPRVEAKIIRGDVAAFFAEMLDAIAKIISVQPEVA